MRAVDHARVVALQRLTCHPEGRFALDAFAAGAQLVRASVQNLFVPVLRSGDVCMVDVLDSDAGMSVSAMLTRVFQDVLTPALVRSIEVGAEAGDDMNAATRAYMRACAHEAKAWAACTTALTLLRTWHGAVAARVPSPPQLGQTGLIVSDAQRAAHAHACDMHAQMMLGRFEGIDSAAASAMHAVSASITDAVALLQASPVGDDGLFTPADVCVVAALPAVTLSATLRHVLLPALLLAGVQVAHDTVQWLARDGVARRAVGVRMQPLVQSARQLAAYTAEIAPQRVRVQEAAGTAAVPHAMLDHVHVTAVAQRVQALSDAATMMMTEAAAASVTQSLVA